MECIKTFPYSRSGFIERTKDMSLQALFDTSTATKQLAAMVDRVTYLGVSELLLGITLVSLRSLDIDDACITGALLERQIDGLEGSRWKDGVRIAVGQMLVDVLGLYGPEMPIRRARVLLKCMEFAYHAGPDAIAEIGTPKEIGNEVERLLLAQVSCLNPNTVCFTTHMGEIGL
jgi:separase